VADCNSSDMRPDRCLDSSMGTEWTADRNPLPLESSKGTDRALDPDNRSDKSLEQFGSTSVDRNSIRIARTLIAPHHSPQVEASIVASQTGPCNYMPAEPSTADKGPADRISG
jgi:hypothetical protein